VLISNYLEAISMMRGLVRDMALVGVAVGLGWWARGGNGAVMAQQRGSSSSSSARGASSSGDSNLAFQMMGDGPNAALLLYNPANRELYIYERVGSGNSSVSCAYSFSIANPGAAIRRENCPVGQLNP
jgi:hypothetical protein